MIGHHRRMERREERREHRHGHTPPPPMMPVPVPPAPEPVPRAAGAAPCKYSHCTAAATFGFADEPGAPLYCITHKSDEMIALVVAPPPAAVAPPAAAAKTCEFARCTAPATHGFADEGIARFCCAHSAVDNTMIEIAGVAPSVAAAAAGKAGSTMQPSPAFEGNAGAVSPATASLLKEYDAAGAREKELAQLTTGADANARHQAEVGNKVKALEHEVASLALAISETQEHLERQNHKPSLGGRSMFGKGLFVRDEEKVAALTKELEEQRARHHAAKAELQQACSKLEVLQVEGAKLASLDSEKRQLHERRSHIHNKVVSTEPQPAALETARRQKVHLSLVQQQLDYTVSGVQQSRGHFARAMALEQQAQRGNMGAVVMEGPGERLMQARRDKMSQEAAREAGAGAKELTQILTQIPTELYTKYPSQMAGVGRGVEVPKLWEGRFGRDVMVGAVFGDVGDGVNQLRAARGVRENQEQIARCDRIAEEQQRRLAAVAAGLQAEQAALDRQIREEEHGVFNRAQARYSTSVTGTDGVAGAAAKLGAIALEG